MDLRDVWTATGHQSHDIRVSCPHQNQKQDFSHLFEQVRHGLLLPQRGSTTGRARCKPPVSVYFQTQLHRQQSPSACAKARRSRDLDEINLSKNTTFGVRGKHCGLRENRFLQNYCPGRLHRSRRYSLPPCHPPPYCAIITSVCTLRRQNVTYRPRKDLT